MNKAPSITRPYVGVTGYTHRAQRDAVHAAVRPLLGDRILMDGVLLWAHTFDEKWQATGDHPVDLPTRFPTLDEAVALAASADDAALLMAHWRTAVEHSLDEQLAAAATALGLRLDGVQINWLARPEPAELSAFLSWHDEHRRDGGLGPAALVLQLHPRVLESASTPGDLLRYLAPYVEGRSITHVLYDPSGGQGQQFNPQAAAATAIAIRQEFPQLHLGVAGGLDPDNVSTVMRQLWSLDPALSIDVEGRVRRPDTDELDLSRTIAYASNALKEAQRHPLPAPVGGNTDLVAPPAHINTATTGRQKSAPRRPLQ